MGNETMDGAIAALERSIQEYEQKIRSLRSAINTLCEQAGMAPRYSETMTAETAKLAQIQSDTFYGKKQTPAMRMYLEIRKAQGLGPAMPREIFEALKVGGYQFEAKDDTNAMIGLRGLLRTQPVIFHRLPQGSYGLTSWYPDAKRTTADQPVTRKGKKAKKKRGTGSKASASTPDNEAEQLPALKLIGSSEKPKAA